MPVVDQRYVEQFINRQTPEDAAWLSTALERPALQQRRRLAQRDEAIRRALAHLAAEFELNPSHRLATQLYAQAIRPGRTVGDHILSSQVTIILELNDGKPLKESQLRNIAKGERSPVQ